MRPTVAILTPTPIEWVAMCKRLANVGEPEDQTLPTRVGRIGSHTIVCVQSGKGQANTAAALQDVLNRWKPRWVILVGIAGGFPDLHVRRGDVVVANFVYYVEFGKLADHRYIRRPEYDYPPDRSLLAHAETLAEAGDRSWIDQIGMHRPDGQPSAATRVHVGYVASGDKVIDDPDHVFFQAVRATVPEIHAVEMEASGAGASIRLEQSRRAVGFLMVRGISDEPTPPSAVNALPGSDQRKLWKAYAAATAAVFVHAFLSAFRRYADTAPVYPAEPTAHPQPPVQLPSFSANESNRFHFAARWTPFLGRENELKQLKTFLGSDRRFTWWIITGSGGVGKSRLALKLCLENSTNWRAGFLPESHRFNFWDEWQPEQPTLLIADYAANRQYGLQAIVTALQERSTSLGQPVRLLLLERSAGSRWWHEFKGTGRTKHAIEEAQFAPPLAIGPMLAADLWEIISFILKKAGITTLPDRHSTLVALEALDSDRRPLFAALAADALVAHRDIRHWDQNSLLKDVLEREQARFWQPAGVSEQDKNLLALVTMAGGLPIDVLEDPSLEKLIPSAFAYEPERYQAMLAMLALIEKRVLRKARHNTRYGKSGAMVSGRAEERFVPVLRCVVA